MEEGVWRKEHPVLRLALAFPDKYEVGMSYLGHKILYGIVNEREGWQAERVMAPDLDAARLLRERGLPLCTLESGRPLGSADAIGFAVTNELAYTNVLEMLDLAGIPLRSAARGKKLGEWPLVLLGGGAALGAEALAPFADLMLLGDGEESLPETLEVLQAALAGGADKEEFLRRAARIPGVYVPSFFRDDGLGGVEPLYDWHARPGRRVVEDLNAVPYPARQVVPVGAVHERLALEIARGCTRGCRFCHAGMVYRPVRERSVDNLARILDECLDRTGFEEISFLSLSTGDFSALGALCEKTMERCARERITLSLPSLRVGSLDDDIIAQLARLRRAGATIAPEAGSQRLRDIINKGVSEKELLAHVKSLAAFGWRQVKLYFMIGLPGETDEDLAAIVELCRRARVAGRPEYPAIAVTAALSPFVPKPFTPFQWEAQIDVAEMRRRIDYVRSLAFRGLKIHWHEPEMSHLEGLLSRAGRQMADVVEKAWRKGAVFCAWHEHFDFAPWREALAECGIDPGSLTGEREVGSRLPWSHLESGIAEEFLQRERARARQGKVTGDCRYGACHNCGACDTPAGKSLLPGHGHEKYGTRLNFSRRDQEGRGALPASAGCRPPKPETDSQRRAATYKVWHTRLGDCKWLSQLEFYAALQRALRRARLPVAFSRGFHPMPRISFGRALPVGLESGEEWFLLGLSGELPEAEIAARLNRFLPKGARVFAVERLEGKGRAADAQKERFLLQLPAGLVGEAAKKFAEFAARDSFVATRTGGKKTREIDLRPCLRGFDVLPEGIIFETDWSENYVSPLFLLEQALGPLYRDCETRQYMRLVKTGRGFAAGELKTR